MPLREFCGRSWRRSLGTTSMDSQNLASLFRAEAVEAQTRRLHGDVILQQSLSTRVVTTAIVLIVAAAIAWVVMGHYARVETTRGMLVPVGGYAKVYAPRPGIVTALLVKDG